MLTSKTFYQFDCIYFNGYKPCRFKRSCTQCKEYKVAKTRILIISLEAMGAVMRATCLLPGIAEKYPNAHITWVTMPVSAKLLENNPYINQLMPYNFETDRILSQLKFDVLFCVDKSQLAGSLAMSIDAKIKKGFGMSELGVIIPFDDDANYQFDLGQDDHLKFKVNTKPETEQLYETMGLEYKKQEYVLQLSEAEDKKRIELLQTFGNKKIIGYNTGSSNLFSYKRFTVLRAIELIAAWRLAFPDAIILLLGGPEDTERQLEMKAAFAQDSMVINTPTKEGLRNGMIWMSLADVVFTGCSLGLHLAVALKKQVIAWFGVSCLQEIELYGRGVRLQSDVSCSPCWKKECLMPIKCYDQVAVEKIIEETRQILKML